MPAPRFDRRVRQQIFDRLDDVVGLGHAAWAEFAARHLALVGSDKDDAVLAQRRNIPPRRRMLPHADIHRGRNEHLLVGREQHGGGEIAGQALRHLGEEVGGRRRHHDQVGLARKTDMPDLGFVLQIEQIGEGFFLGEHGERKRRDEFGAGACQDGAHGSAPLLQAAHELEALIGGDAAADDQQDALALHGLLTPSHSREGGNPVTIDLTNNILQGLLDCRVKPGNDKK